MQDIVVGVVSVVVGAMFCFRGYLTMRVVIPIWGAFAGFGFGASLVTTFTDEAFLRNLAGWLVGLGFALVFAVLAYVYYEISVVVVMATIGFVLGATFMIALDVRWNWVVIAIGVIVAMLLAGLAVIADLPTWLLVLLTALAGSSAIVIGLMLLTGVAETEAFSSSELVASVEDAWWWWVIYSVIAVFGVIAQARAVEDLRADLRASWAASGGRDLRGS